MTQTALFQQPNTWLHFIGSYYRTSDLFLVETQKHGFSRRIPAQVARGMHFGDKVIFLRYGGASSRMTTTAKTVFAFGEGVVTRVTFAAEIAAQLGQELERRGLAEYTSGGDTVLRACGSYLMAGTWTVTAEMEIPLLVEAATQIAQAQGATTPLFVMLGGELTAAYEAPVFLQPAPHFTRGFIKTEPGSTYQYTGMVGEYAYKMLAVKHYRKAAKSLRLPRAGRKAQGQLALSQ
jgi:hypothetical protein